MVLYTCPRCHYKTTQKNDIRKHLFRKRPCIITHESKTIQDCINDILGKNEGKCVENALEGEKNALKSVENALLDEKDALISVQEALKSVECVENALKEISPKNNHIVRQDSQNDCKCENCGRVFKKRRYLIQHINRYNKCKPSQNTNQIINEISLELSDSKGYQQELSQKDVIITELRNQISNLVEKVGNTTNYTTNYIVNINPFGKENTNYISSECINKLINDGPVTSIPKLLKMIHFHPEHEENHNVKIPNKKQPYAQIFDGQDWIYADKKETIDDMSNKAYSFINGYYEGGNKYMNQFKEMFEENNILLAKRINRDVELLVINSQSIINN